MGNKGGSVWFKIYLWAIYCCAWALMPHAAYSSILEDSAMVTGFAKGYALTADIESNESVAKNPALLTSIQDKIANLNVGNHFNGLYQSAMFSYITPISTKIKVGIFCPLNLVKGIPETIDNNGQGLQIGSFSDMHYEPKISVATSLLDDKISLGLSAKYEGRKIQEERASRFGADIGLTAHISDLYVGLTAENIVSSALNWKSGAKETVLPTIHGGLRYHYGITYLADVTHTAGNPTEFNAGLSWKATGNLAIFGGVKDLTSTRQYRLGLDLKLSKIGFTYAFGSHSELGITHKAGCYVEF